MKVKREEAIRIILDTCRVLPSEVVTVEDAEGRVISEDVLSGIDVPDEDKSAIDGFAFSHLSVKSLPARLKVIGETPAGSESLSVREGEAVFVMTGGVIPDGADAAVRVEDVRVEGDEVVIDFPVERGNLVNFRGSEIRKGDLIVRAGTLLNGRLTALLAYIGVYRVKVHLKPRVGIFVTGDEILEPYEPYRKGAVRNSNLYLLKGLLKAYADVHYLGRLKDDPELMKGRISRFVEDFDILVTTGGVSKGRYDFVRSVVEDIGFNVRITSTNIRPGRPLVFASLEEKLFFGLPGYPSAMLVNALEFLLPPVRKIAGFREFANRYMDVVAGENLRSRRGRVDFVRVRLSNEGGTLVAYSAGSQQTSNFITSVYCDGFAVIPEELDGAGKGDVVKFIPLEVPW